MYIHYALCVQCQVTGHATLLVPSEYSSSFLFNGITQGLCIVVTSVHYLLLSQV